MCRAFAFLFILISANCWAITGGSPVGESFKNVGFLSTYVRGKYQSEVNLWGFIRDKIGALRQFNADRCVVTRITKNTLITAAHCLKEEDGSDVDGSEVNLQNRIYAVDHFEVHRDFRMDTILNFISAMPQYDVAILVSKEMEIYEPEFEPIELPKSELTHGQNLTAVGRQHWNSDTKGLVTGNYGTTTKMSALFDVQDVSEDVSWKKLNLFDKYSMVSSASTIRPGDSGGPTFLIKDSKLTLVGIHSMVVSCRDCQPNWVNIDTSIYKYREWIERTTTAYR